MRWLQMEKEKQHGNPQGGLLSSFLLQAEQQEDCPRKSLAAGRLSFETRRILNPPTRPARCAGLREAALEGLKHLQAAPQVSSSWGASLWRGIPGRQHVCDVSHLSHHPLLMRHTCAQTPRTVPLQLEAQCLDPFFQGNKDSCVQRSRAPVKNHTGEAFLSGKPTVNGWQPDRAARPMAGATNHLDFLVKMAAFSFQPGLFRSSTSQNHETSHVNKRICIIIYIHTRILNKGNKSSLYSLSSLKNRM